MFFKQKSDVIYRNYEKFGYITDNRNYGYRQKNVIGDKIVSQSGAVFLSVLSRKPQTLDELAGKIIEKYVDVDIETIKSDAKEFYNMLEQDGFIVSGETLQECDKKDIVFSYKALEPEFIKKDISPIIMRTEKSTQEFLNEYFKDRPILTSLHVEITSKCNERCVHCYIPHENKINDIEPELFYNILAQCKEMGLLNLTLSGGEPMMHRNFCEFLRKCKEYDFSVNVLSNLISLNDEIIAEMRANRLLSVQVSLYSMNSEIHDEITKVKGSFEKTKNAILKLIENDIPLQINCPIMKQNKNCYIEVLNWAKEHKINAGNDYVMIARYDHTTQNLNNRLSLDEVGKIINNIIENDTEYQEKMKKEDVVEEEKRDISNDVVCSICNSSICIADNGNVYPCAGWQDYVVGNVKEKSLKEIWNNSEKVLYLRNLHKKDFPKCIKCPDKDFCVMCMVRNANEHQQGNPLEINKHFCKVVKLNKKILFEWKEKLKNA
ncbi:MAG: radical SAM protein [Chitinispirillales bacterium]|nr:radical SAM protein [Chitinispirillales bacterium]